MVIHTTIVILKTPTKNSSTLIRGEKDQSTQVVCLKWLERVYEKDSANYTSIQKRKSNNYTT